MEHKVSTCAPFVPCFHFLTIFDRMTGDRLAFRFYLQNLAFSNLSLTEFQAETIETSERENASQFVQPGCTYSAFQLTPP